MKMIKGLVSIILVLAILIFLIAPPAIGLWVKQDYSTLIDKMNKMYPNMTVTVSRYYFGWFTSKIDVNVDLHIQPVNLNNHVMNSRDNIRVNGLLEIHHGPFIFAKQDRHYKIFIALADIKTRIPELNLTANSLWHFNNAMATQYSSPGFELHHNRFYALMKNMQGTSYYDRDTQQLQLQFTVGSFSLENQLTLKRICYAADIDQDNLINYGRQKLSIGKAIVYLRNQTNPLQMNNVLAQSNTTRNNSHVNMILHYDIASISQNIFDTQSVKADLSINDINAESMTALLMAIENQKSHLNPSVMPYKNLIAPIMDLLRHGLTIHVHKIRLKTSSGDISLHGTFIIPQLDHSASFWELPMNISADFNFQTPKMWLKQQMSTWMKYSDDVTNQTLQQWENQNLLITSGDDYSARIQFQKGHIWLNGKTPEIPPKLPSNENTQPRKTI